MRKLLLLAAAISALTLPGAFACEYGHQAANTDRTTVACSGGNCQADQPTAANAPLTRLVVSMNWCRTPAPARTASAL
jgi:hypothetical protein